MNLTLFETDKGWFVTEVVDKVYWKNPMVMITQPGNPLDLKPKLIFSKLDYFKPDYRIEAKYPPTDQIVELYKKRVEQFHTHRKAKNAGIVLAEK